MSEEAKCPDLELNVVVGIEDVTGKVNGAVKAGHGRRRSRPGAALRHGHRSKRTAPPPDGLRCDVVTLYAGGMYHLYKYKKYTDVRLVFAPEFEIAFFGGDPDNFTYPRYDLDITFFRIYENDKPVHLDNYFKWSKKGVSDGELVFVSGNPGSTGRMNTMAQVEFLRDAVYPMTLKIYKQRIDALKSYSAQSAENARQAQEYIFGYENSFKAITGYQSGLLDKKLMAQKQAEENKTREAIAGRPQEESRVRRSLGRDCRRRADLPEHLSCRIVSWNRMARWQERYPNLPARCYAWPPKSRNPTASVCASTAIRRCPRWSNSCSRPLLSTRACNWRC